VKLEGKKIRDWNLKRQNDVVDIISGKYLKFHLKKIIAQS